MRRWLGAFALVVLWGGHLAHGMKRDRHSRSDSRDECKKSRSIPATRYGKAVKAFVALPSLFSAESLEQIQAFLKLGASIHERNEYGETPLHYYIRKNRTDAVRVLLMHGAACGVVDRSHYTPYHAAKNAEMVYCLMKNAQGGPQWCTDAFRTWQKSIITSSIIFNKFGVCKDVRLKLVKTLVPEVTLLPSMVPLRYLPYYMQFYSLEEKEILVNRLVKRHIADTRYALVAKNKYHETPQQQAVHNQNRMLPHPPPIGPLDLSTLSNNKGEIREQYCILLGVPFKRDQ